MNGFDPDKDGVDAFIAKMRQRKPEKSLLGERIEISKKYFLEEISHNEICSKIPDSYSTKHMPPSQDIAAALAEIDRVNAEAAAELRRSLVRESVCTASELAAFRRDVPEYLAGLKQDAVADLRPELVDPFHEAMDQLRRREAESAVHLRRALERRPFDFLGFDTARQPTPISTYDEIMAELRCREKTNSKLESYKIIKNNNPEEIIFDHKPFELVAELRNSSPDFDALVNTNNSAIVRAALRVVSNPAYVRSEAQAILDGLMIVYDCQGAAADRFDRSACRNIADAVVIGAYLASSKPSVLDKYEGIDGKVTPRQVVDAIFVGKVREEYVKAVGAKLDALR